jgi:hypothetical protein
LVLVAEQRQQLGHGSDAHALNIAGKPLFLLRQIGTDRGGLHDPGGKIALVGCPNGDGTKETVNEHAQQQRGCVQQAHDSLPQTLILSTAWPSSEHPAAEEMLPIQSAKAKRQTLL